MTRPKEFVSFEFAGRNVLIPSIKEAPALALLTQDIVVRALVPDPDTVLALPSPEFQEFIEKWAAASKPEASA